MQPRSTKPSELERQGRGRPRDPAIEGRILDAALTLYGNVGWLGFNLDAVARTARVSKDALYRRWTSRETLLQSALESRWDWMSSIDTGNIREDLVALASRTFDTFAGLYGEVALQLRADARRFAEVRAFAEPYRAMIVQQGRGIVRRAIQRGELSAKVNPGVIVDLLVGCVINHISSTPEDLRERMLAASNDFVNDVVSIITAGSEKVYR